jgi:hypothetical protein
VFANEEEGRRNTKTDQTKQLIVGDKCLTSNKVDLCKPVFGIRIGKESASVNKQFKLINKN